MIKFWNFVKGILLRRESGVITYDSENEGSLYNNQDLNIRTQIQGADRAVVTDTQTQTLTNKSIDADTNTITNIENADIKAAAAIDASKIADGSVSNTEFQYLSTVTSNVQDQLDAKASTTDLNNHLNNATDAHDASAISSVSSGNLAATDVQSALNELQSDIDTRALASDLSNHLSDTSDAHDASAISSIPSGNLAATDVQAALNELQSDIDTRLTASSTNTITNKTIDGDDNTIQDLALTSLKTNITDASKFIVRDASGIPVSNTKAVPTGDVVGTSDPQSLSAKTLVTPIVDNAIDLNHETTPANPAAGILRFYPKSNNKLYTLTSAGVETEIGSGGSSSSSSGRNYFSANSDFETDTTGYTTYDDGSVAAPVNGAGGSPSSSIARSTTTPLRGTADLNWVHTAADNRGEGFSYDITIDNADLAKMMHGSFDYEIVSGTYATGDATMYIVQDPAGTPVIIQPAGYQIQNIAGKAKHIYSFQTDSSVTTYRICWHIATTTATAWTMAIDNVALGPQTIQYGAPITDPVAYTPTFTGFGTATSIEFTYERHGANLKVFGKWTAGTSTAVESRVSLPAGLTSASTDKIPSIRMCGKATSSFSSGASTVVNVLIEPSTAYFTFAVRGESATNALTKVTGDSWTGAGTIQSFFAEIPILGWSSTVQMSNDTDTRVVAAKYSTNAGSTSTNNTTQILDFEDKVFDTHGAVTGTGSGIGGSWRYTFQVPGFYKINAQIQFDDSSAWTAGEIVSLSIFKNGTLSENNVTGIGATYTSAVKITADISTTISVVAGDYFDIRLLQNSGSNLPLNASGAGNFVTVERISGPSAIAASESVNARYTSTAGQSIANATTAIVDFGTKDYDSHGAVTTGASWKFTAPISGKYSVSTRMRWSSAAWAAIGNNTTTYLYKNGSEYSYLDNLHFASTNAIFSNGYDEIYLLAGQYIDIRVSHDESAARSFDANANRVTVSISRIGN